MRKLFVTLLTVSLLAGLFLAGTMPVMAATTAPDRATRMAAVVDCAHHDGTPKPLPQKHSGHGDLTCCVNGHCPMLGQALMPAEAAAQPSPMGSLLRPIVLALDRGIVDAPHPRPPSDIL